MARHVRKGDNVIVTSGSSKGKQGKILRVLTEKNQVLVEGANVRARNVKPSQNNPQGGVVSKEMPIHISNVSPVAAGKPTRVRFVNKEDGSKIRVAASTGEQLGPALKKARK